MVNGERQIVAVEACWTHLFETASMRRSTLRQDPHVFLRPALLKWGPLEQAAKARCRYVFLSTNLPEITERPATRTENILHATCTIAWGGTSGHHSAHPHLSVLKQAGLLQQRIKLKVQQKGPPAVEDWPQDARPAPRPALEQKATAQG